MDIFDSINMLRVAAAEASRGFRPDMKKAAAFNDGADALEFMLRFKQKLDDTYAEAKEITKNVKILLNEKGLCSKCEHSYWGDPECNNCKDYKYFQRRE